MSDVSFADLLLKSLPALNRRVSRELAFELRRHRVSKAQYLVIELLLEKGSLPPRKISAALELDQSTVVSTLTRMERDGFIWRGEDSADGRSVLVHLTEEAKKAAADCKSAVDQISQSYAAKLSEAETESLEHLLAKLIS